MSNSQLSTLDSQALHRFCSTPLPTLINLIGSRLRLQLSPTLSSSSDSPNPIPHSHLDQFQAITIPPMTIEAYLTRLITLSPISADAILLALLYLHRSSTLPLIPSLTRPRHPSLPSVSFQILTIHRMLLSSLIIANKFISDHFLSASRASKVGGVRIEELASLERGLLECLGFVLSFTTQEIEQVAQWALDEPLPTPSDSVPLALATLDLRDPSPEPHLISQSHTIPHPHLIPESHSETRARLTILEPQPILKLKSQLLNSQPSSPELHAQPVLESSTQPSTEPRLVPLPVISPNPTNEPTPRTNKPRGRVFLRAHFVRDPNLNSNYLSRRPSMEFDEVEGADGRRERGTRIVITKLDQNVLKVRTELVGCSSHLPGEKLSRTMSNRSYNYSLT